MPLSQICSEIDEELSKFYVQPKFTFKQVGTKVDCSETIIDKAVNTLYDVFKIENLKNLYIQGDPGMGKTTFSVKLTLDWCLYMDEKQGLQEPGTRHNDQFSALRFDFLFLISLRESNNGKCEVSEMVKDGVLDKLKYDKTYSQSFLSQVLDKEHCLIILDGLDEWSQPENRCSNSAELIPHRISSGNCVYLTLSRPWKLNQICLKDSEIDVLLEIGGVRNPEELVSKVVSSLNRKGKKIMHAEEFNVATKHLADLKKIPIIAMQLICIWHENGSIPESLCSIYCAMIKMILKRKKYDDMSGKLYKIDDLPHCLLAIRCSKEEKTLLFQLGKLAFETLFPPNGQQSHVVFTDKFARNHLEDQMKKVSLSAGLLTEKKIRCLNEKESHLSFLHKTFQEFLAGVYLYYHRNQREDFVSRVTNKSENFHDISQLFLFLCGFDPKLASAILNTSTRNIVVNGIFKKNKHDIMLGDSFVWTLNYLMDIVYSGYTEGIRNGHKGSDLEIAHICFSNKLHQMTKYEPEKLFELNIRDAETIICTENELYQDVKGIIRSNIKTIKTLWLSTLDESLDLTMCTCLQSFIVSKHVVKFREFSFENKITEPVTTDLSECQYLEGLVIMEPNITVNISTDKLQTCILKDYDFSRGNIIEILTKRCQNLRNLQISYKMFSSKTRKKNKCFHLNLTPCSSLEWLFLSCFDIAVSINTTNLHWCYLKDYVLSQGNIAESLKNAKSLTELTISDCKTSTVRTEGSRRINIDLTSCSKLKNIAVSNSDIALSINTTNLHHCKLEDYDFLHGNIAEDMKNARSVTKLHLHCFKHILVNQNFNTRIHLDLTLCSSLKHLTIFNYDVVVSINATQLSDCYLDGYDLSQGNIAEEMKTAKLLHSLTLTSCKISSLKGRESRNNPLDLTSCSRLTCLHISQCNFAVSINTTHLYTCELCSYYWTHGNVKEIKTATSLRKLTLRDCKATILESDEGKHVELDLLSCSSLEDLEISKCDIAMSINTTNLRRCRLYYCDMSLGNLAEDLKTAKLLTALTIKNCNQTAINNYDSRRLSLQSCSSLENFYISRGDVGVSSNTTDLDPDEISGCEGNIVQEIKTSKSLIGLTSRDCQSPAVNNGDNTLTLQDCKSTEPSVVDCRGRKFNLDLTLCNNLKKLTITGCNIDLGINISKINHCDLTDCVLSQKSIADKTQTAKLLTTLILQDCKYIADENDDSKINHLDLTSCIGLEQLTISKCDFAVSINATNLLKCKLSDYDLSKGNIAKEIATAKSLTQLTLQDCKSTPANSGDSRSHLDLTSCSSLKNLNITRCDIVVSVDASKIELKPFCFKVN